MQRRDLFKMLATLVAVPFVAPLVAMCKPKQASVCMPSMDVLTYDPSKFKSRPPDVSIGSYGEGLSSDLAFLQLSLHRFIECAFHFHEAQKVLMESPTILASLDSLRTHYHRNIHTDHMFGVPVERWTFPNGEILIPQGIMPDASLLTHENTIYETNYPGELARVKRDLAIAIIGQPERTQLAQIGTPRDWSEKRIWLHDTAWNAKEAGELAVKTIRGEQS